MPSRGEEKVTRLGLHREPGQLVLFLHGEVIALQDGQQRVLARPAIVEEEGWTYFIDADGDLGRKPMPGWVPSEAERRRLAAAPLAALHATPLADVQFTTLRVHGTTIHESTALTAGTVAKLWPAAQLDGFSPVVVRERLSTRTFKRVEAELPELRRELDEMDWRTVIAKRERELRAELDGSLWRRRRKELAAAGPATPVEQAYIFQQQGETARRFLCLMSCEPWALPLYCSVAGFNEAPSDTELAAVLRYWWRNWDAVPVFICRDAIEIEARQRRGLASLRQLAWEQYLLAPDIVDQGTLTLDALVAAIANGRWWLWWD